MFRTLVHFTATIDRRLFWKIFSGTCPIASPKASNGKNSRNEYRYIVFGGNPVYQPNVVNSIEVAQAFFGPTDVRPAPLLPQIYSDNLFGTAQL